MFSETHHPRISLLHIEKEPFNLTITQFDVIKSISFYESRQERSERTRTRGYIHNRNNVRVCNIQNIK